MSELLQEVAGGERAGAHTSLRAWLEAGVVQASFAGLSALAQRDAGPDIGLVMLPEAANDPRQHIPLSQDAAVVLALAGTAMAFSHSAEDEAERWLRAMRMHGRVGQALQGLGVGESPLMTGSESRPGRPPLGTKVADDVTTRAQDYAFRRNAPTVGTPELLFAVMEVYGQMFDRALYLRGASREELLERLSSVEHDTEPA